MDFPDNELIMISVALDDEEEYKPEKRENGYIRHEENEILKIYYFITKTGE